ncbi:MAG: T9SS type A sorting domain-containing protein [Melioribacteraceae bacterium]
MTVNYSVSDYSSSTYKFTITDLANINGGPEDKWGKIGDGTVLKNEITYSNGSFVSDALKSKIQGLINANSSFNIILGAFSESELTAGSYANVDLEIKVIYTTPPQPITLTVRNDLDGNNGGEIGVGVNANASRVSSPFMFVAFANNIINLSAYDDNPMLYNYNWVFNDTEAPSKKSGWEKFGGSSTQWSPQTATTSYTTNSQDNNAILVAYLRKKCDVTVSSSNYPIYINGSAYYYSTALSIVEGNQFNASLQCDPIFSQNGQMQFFSHWTINGTPLYPNVLINAHSSVNPVYVNRPVYNGFKQVFYGQTVGQPIEIYWTENPNTQITEYEIWRRVKSNGVLGPETKIATVGRGVQLHTDYAYALTDGYTDKLILYDVREHNTVTGGYSSPSYEAVYGTSNLEKISDKMPVASNEVPTNYSISNYPNPFNPTTTINYQLPKDGMVTIKVYDIIGKEVATLVNGHKSAGYYKIDFDASKLTSGVYIAAIQASSFNKSIKLLLTK